MEMADFSAITSHFNDQKKSTSGQIASNLSVACGVGPTTCTRIVQKSEPFFNTDMLQLPAS
jgi:hypothetical protein